jgi:hypothetical protein
MDKYNAQEPRTANAINNGNITNYVYHNNTIIYTITLLIMKRITLLYILSVCIMLFYKKLSKATYLVST